MTEDSENLTTSYETIRTYTYEQHERVLRETWSADKGFCKDWIDMHDHWINLCRSLLASEEEEYLSSQITFHRFVELLRNLRWHMTAVFSGAYESAIRDLRFILEDMCQAVYFDQSFGQLGIEQRYQKARGRARSRGARLVGKIGLAPSIERQFVELHNELCNYVHPSYRLLLESSEDLKVVLFYKEEWFRNAQVLHRQTCDAVFYLVLRTFPKACPVFFSKKLVVSSLKEMLCVLTLSLM